MEGLWDWVLRVFGVGFSVVGIWGWVLSGLIWGWVLSGGSLGLGLEGLWGWVLSRRDLGLGLEWRVFGVWS